ncbi:ExbD/TolR family protein [Prosthecobacter sp.]|uniref:ExbD/TolR family protein n=1 Tax=Prosthecobacter sp. TaxID=1965333 RepID=UPI003783136A
MNRHSNRHQLRLITEISITPLMDLVLVLLFVFLLAAPLLKADKETPAPTAATAAVVPAPPPASASSNAPKEAMTLQINRDQSVTLNGAMLARADLPVSLKQIAQRNPDIGIEIRIHRDLPVQQLAETMQMLELAGIQKTAVTTHAEEP